MFLSSLIEELRTKEENNKAGCTLTFGWQCITGIRDVVLIIFSYFQKHKSEFFT